MLFRQTVLSQLPAATPAPSFTGVLDEFRAKAVAAAPNILTGAAVLLVFWIVAAVGRRLIALTAPRVKADTGVVLLLSRLYYYGVLSFGFLTALGTAGIEVGALVAGLGLTGFALGFALKDAVSNLLAGVLVLAYRPFRSGDRIQVAGFQGDVVRIDLRYTVLDDDGARILIPNQQLFTNAITLPRRVAPAAGHPAPGLAAGDRAAGESA
jgi:small conductance mechanosensitive channel